jgi:hypothetical protein
MIDIKYLVEARFFSLRVILEKFTLSQNVILI